MPNKLSNYLDSIEAHLKGDSAVKANVLHEIRTHLEDKSQELKESGLSEEEAVRLYGSSRPTKINRPASL